MTSLLRPVPDRLPVAAPTLRLAHVRSSLGSFDAVHAEHVSVRFPPHIHDGYAFGLIGKGANRFSYRGTRCVAAAGALLAISPGELHGGEAITDEGWSYRTIYPSPELVLEALDEGPATGSAVLFRDAILDAPDIARAFLTLHAGLLAPSCTLARDERLVHFLRTIVARFAVGTSKDGHPRSRGREVALRAHAYLHDHFRRPVGLLELSQVCGVSAFHLIRCFRDAVGLPPHAYLKALRVSRAQAMLQGGSSISDVAYDCGFSDQSHLTRNFKRVTGLSPGAYARMVRGCPVSMA